MFAVSGICDRFTRYSDGISKTLNTGIVTTLNFNKQVAREVSYLTFAHELGHNMGSNVSLFFRRNLIVLGPQVSSTCPQLVMN